MSSLSLPTASEWGYQLQEISPDELVTAVSEAVEAALLGYRVLPDAPELCTDAEGYTRASVEIELPTILADQLMNGRTGYRAHYSMSVEAGDLFNRKLVEAIAPLIIEAEDFYSSRFDSRFCKLSLLGPFSKIWYSKQLTDPSAQAHLLGLNKVLLNPRWIYSWSKMAEPHKGLLAPNALLCTSERHVCE